MKKQEELKMTILEYAVLILTMVLVSVMIHNHALCRSNAELRYELLVSQCKASQTEMTAENMVEDLEKMEIDPYLADDRRRTIRIEVENLRKEIIERRERGDFQEIPEPSAVNNRIRMVLSNAFKPHRLSQGSSWSSEWLRKNLPYNAV